jgi:hypothetical protein
MILATKIKTKTVPELESPKITKFLTVAATEKEGM